MIYNMKRIVGLDYLRVYTVLVVFLFHSWMHLGCSFGKLTSFVSEGAVYMTLFFMMSGYVLGLKYKEIPMEKTPLLKFYKKRLISILPLYVVCAVLYPPIFGEETWLQNLLILPIELLCLQSTFSLLMPVSHNGGTWFVSCIIFCYLLFPLATLLLKSISKRYVWIVVSIMYLVLVISPWIVFVFHGEQIYSNSFFRFLEFSIGVVLAVNAESIQNKNRWLNNKISILTSYVMVIVVVMMLLKMQIPHVTYMSYSAVLIPFFAWQLLAHSTKSRLTDNKMLKYCADISYAFFLMQLFVFKLTKNISQYFQLTNIYILFLISFLLCFCLASLGHRYVERPLANRTRKNI